MSTNAARTSWYCMILLSVSMPAAAQQPTPATPAVTPSSQSSAQAEAGEPRADTGAMDAAPPASTRAPAAPASVSPPDSPRAAAAPAGPTPGAATPAVGSSPAGTPAGGPAAPTKRASAGGNATAAGQKSTAVDRLDLGVATVTGDREQPKVMYIVPWKKSDIGDLSGKPMHSLLDEALAPVDRDEFKREVLYYQAVNADASQNGAPRQPAKQGEK